MPFGTVKWFNDEKGYGFLRPDGGGGDVFVHHSGIVMEGFRTLQEGERVQYDLVVGPSGKSQAENVIKEEAKTLP